MSDPLCLTGSASPPGGRLTPQPPANAGQAPLGGEVRTRKRRD